MLKLYSAPRSKITDLTGWHQILFGTGVEMYKSDYRFDWEINTYYSVRPMPLDVLLDYWDTCNYSRMRFNEKNYKWSV